MERDSAIYANMAVLPISTHTLTWSVTNLRCQRLYSGGISTHTLTWSVTIMPFASLSTSIFQLTRSRGAWRNIFLKTLESQLFQLTRSRGAWPETSEFCHQHSYFNSHAHVERDIFAQCFLECIGISTHTLTWSVTASLRLLSFISSFQLTRSRGAWQCRFLNST